MAAYVRFNSLDQVLDIAGSLTKNQTRVIGDENAGLGVPQGKEAADDTVSFGAVSSGLQTVTGLDTTSGNFGQADVGRFVTFSGAGLSAGNKGTFLINSVEGVGAITIVNASGVEESDVVGTWDVRLPYSLQDDLDCERTDRKLIKGTTNYYDAIPTYVRPSAIGTDVPANLTNIASKTLDAKALSVNLPVFEQSPYIEVDDGVSAASKTLTSVSAPFVAGDVGKQVKITGLTGGPHIVTIATFVDTDEVTYSEAQLATDTGLVFDILRSAGVMTVTSAGNLKHADAVDRTGVPCYDEAPFTDDELSCFVQIKGLVSEVEQELEVLDGVHAGERIVGLTQNGDSTSPDSVEVKLYSIPKSVAFDIANMTAYDWEPEQVVTKVNLVMGYNKRMDNFAQNDLRFDAALGVVSDADMRRDVDDLQFFTGITNNGDHYIDSYITHTEAEYVLSDMPNLGTTSDDIIDALNTINEQIGDRDYTGDYLTDGETVASSLQALSDALAAAAVVRTIERLSSALPAGTNHALPGALTYTLDGTGNGANMWVFTRGILRHPGTVQGGNDYDETDTTHVTFHGALNAKDIIDYMILQ